MNIKKIWLISLIFGLAAAGIVYISLYAKQGATTTASVNVNDVQDETNDKKAEEEKEKQSKKEAALSREFVNPIADISKGKRAISIKVNLDSGVSGYISPNSMV